MELHTRSQNELFGLKTVNKWDVRLKIKVHLFVSPQEAEKRGFSPEEVYAALCICGGSSANPCEWLTSELPHLLDEICAMAASVQQNPKSGDAVDGNAETSELSDPGVAGEGVKLSRAEAKLAWLTAGGDTERAVRQLLRDRQVKVRS